MLRPRICGAVLLLISALVLWFCAVNDCDATGGVFYMLLGLVMLFVKDNGGDDEEWKE